MSTPQGPGQGSDDQQGGRAWSGGSGRDAPVRPADGAGENDATTVYRPQDHLGGGPGSGSLDRPAAGASAAPPTTAEPVYGQQPGPPNQQPWSPGASGGSSPWAPGQGGYGSPSGGWDRPGSRPDGGGGPQYGAAGYPPGQDNPGGYGSGSGGPPEYGRSGYSPYGQGGYGRPGADGSSGYGGNYGSGGNYGPGAYGPGGGYEQSAGYGQPPSWGTPDGAAAAPPRRNQGLLIGIVALVVLLALAAVALFVWPRPVKGWGPFKNDVFDAQQMNRDVTQVLGNAAPAGYGLSGVSDVDCPSGQEVVPGSRFTCTLQLDGRPTELTVEVLSDSGEYRVNPPN